MQPHCRAPTGSCRYRIVRSCSGIYKKFQEVSRLLILETTVELRKRAFVPIGKMAPSRRKGSLSRATRNLERRRQYTYGGKGVTGLHRTLAHRIAQRLHQLPAQVSRDPIECAE